MKINVFFYPGIAEELYFTGKTSVVIDVFRATNTIITAVENGAKEIIPVNTVDSAVKISKGLFGGQTILCGERNTVKIEGFTLGNSPIEYTSENVKGKTIVFYTTNGSKAVLKAKFSENLFICAFRNISAVARRINVVNKDLEILCSGNPGAISMEDALCAGMLVSEIMKLRTDTELNDSSRTALTLYKSAKTDLAKHLKETDHAKILQEKGFGEDLNYCSKINTTEVIPYLSGNVIKLLPGK